MTEHDDTLAADATITTTNGISISDDTNTSTAAPTTATSQEAPPPPRALTRNERKRRFREEQVARLTATSTSDASGANGGAVKKKQQQLRMPASAFLPLGDELVQRRCEIAYDGSRFQGFQAQERGELMRTVQETIEDALLRTTGETIRLRAASRTDAGVHAHGQVIAFMSMCAAEDHVFRDALNNRLPEDVLCRRMTRTVAGDAYRGDSSLFDPRAHSKRKTYKYAIVNGGLRPVFDRSRVWFVKKPLDVATMNAAIAFLLEAPAAKDYSSFTPQKAAAGDENGNVCTITSIRIVEDVIKHDLSHLLLGTDSSGDPDANLDAGRNLEIVFQGDRFLYKMVRNLVGTLVDVGLGRIAPESIPLILQAKNRSKAGQGAPPQGLTLMRIEYE